MTAADDEANAAPLWAEWIVPLTPVNVQPTEDCCDTAADESSLEECCF